MTVATKAPARIRHLNFSMISPATNSACVASMTTVGYIAVYKRYITQVFVHCDQPSKGARIMRHLCRTSSRPSCTGEKEVCFWQLHKSHVLHSPFPKLLAGLILIATPLEYA